MASRSEYQFGGGGRQHQANNLASALEKQRYEMKIDALKVDVERLRRDRDRARRELERGKAAAKNAVAQVVERLRVEVHSRAIAERERDVLQSDLKRTMRQANDRLEQKTREAARAHEEFLDAKRKLEKLKHEKSLVSRAVEELHHNQDAAATTAANTVTNPTSPRPPPGTKAATAYAANHQQHAPSSSQTSVFVVTSEHVKILVGMILTMLFTVKFLNNGNVNGAAEL
jgi:chromosome segregation ATPase